MSRYVILSQFDQEKISIILQDEDVKKLAIFDENDEYRSEFEKLYKIYGDRITFYEGDVSNNVSEYVKKIPHVEIIS